MKLIANKLEVIPEQVSAIGKFGTFTEENRTTKASNIFQPQCECKYKFNNVDFHSERCLGVVNLIWRNKGSSES